MRKDGKPPRLVDEGIPMRQGCQPVARESTKKAAATDCISTKRVKPLSQIQEVHEIGRRNTAPHSERETVSIFYNHVVILLSLVLVRNGVPLIVLSICRVY
jgi:hypothetical protein